MPKLNGEQELPEMIEAIPEYHKLTFASAEDSLAAVDAIMQYATSPEGLPSLVGPNRLVAWAGDTMDIQNRTLYLSPGGLAVLRRLRPQVPASEAVAPTTLPKGRALLVGDARDWDLTGGV